MPKETQNTGTGSMIAIGKKGSTEILPPELQEKEKLTARKPLKEIIMEGFYHA